MPTVIGLDIAKRVFQWHSVEPETGEIRRLKLQRAELLEYFGNLPPSIVCAQQSELSSDNGARRSTGSEKFEGCFWAFALDRRQTARGDSPAGR
jgi:hypothetical protein